MESEGGRGFISLSTIFWWRARRLKGSTVNGSVPVNIAYMLTPLGDHKHTLFSLMGNNQIYVFKQELWQQLMTF